MTLQRRRTADVSDALIATDKRVQTSATLGPMMELQLEQPRAGWSRIRPIGVSLAGGLDGVP